MVRSFLSLGSLYWRWLSDLRGERQLTFVLSRYSHIHLCRLIDLWFSYSRSGNFMGIEDMSYDLLKGRAGGSDEWRTMRRH